MIDYKYNLADGSLISQFVNNDSNAVSKYGIVFMKEIMNDSVSGYFVAVDSLDKIDLLPNEVKDYVLSIKNSDDFIYHLAILTDTSDNYDGLYLMLNSKIGSYKDTFTSAFLQSINSIIDSNFSLIMTKSDGSLIGYGENLFTDKTDIVDRIYNKLVESNKQTQADTMKTILSNFDLSSMTSLLYVKEQDKDFIRISANKKEE